MPSCARRRIGRPTTWWKQESGVAHGSSLCHEHEVLCEAFRFGHEVDQMNASNLASFELLMRRMIQIEMAVARNSKAPDFSGLSVVLSAVVDGSGAIQTKGFHKWVADKNESRARVMKSERMYFEERANTKKSRKETRRARILKAAGGARMAPQRPATDDEPCGRSMPSLLQLGYNIGRSPLGGARN